MGELTIVEFSKKHAKSFKQLNQRWIEKYFKMEDEDYKTLDYPIENIIDKGGYILMAEIDGVVVGSCALIKMEDPFYDFELAKMAVSPRVQGKGIGMKIGEATLKKAKELGAKSVYLESNTVLETAIRLYYKLGFVEVNDHKSPYARCNIQMKYTI